MSMIGCFRRVPGSLYAELLRDESRVAGVVSGGARPWGRLSSADVARFRQDAEARFSEEKLARLPEPMRSRMKAQLEQMLREIQADQPEGPPTADGAGSVLSVEKMWQALHFLVVGDPFRPGTGRDAFVLGGQACGADLGYGPARMLSPADVTVVARELPDAEVLRASFDPAKLAAADVYPGVWDEDPEELWEELSAYYESLRTYYREAARAGDAMVLWIG